MDDASDRERARHWRWWLWPALTVSFVLFALPQVFFIALGLWVVVAAIVAPLMVGARPVVGLTSMRAWPFAVGALMLLLGFWSILAGAFVWMRGPRPAAEVTTARDLRRAA